MNPSKTGKNKLRELCVLRGEDNYLMLINCVFTDNETNYGGGIYNNDSGPILINCTFYGNTADSNGNDMYNHDSSPKLTNCILWDDSPVYNSSSSPTYNYCNVKGGVMNSDPKFVDDTVPEGPDGLWATIDDGLALRTDSPCKDTGDNVTVDNIGLTVDIVGRARKIDGNHDTTATVDMGAYELLKIWHVDGDVSGGNDDGSSWAHAYNDLQEVLTNQNVAYGDEIWVAAATNPYLPGSNREDSFVLVEGVEIYGGFTGSMAETAREDRNWSSNATILSGDIDGGNSYHVVTGADNATIDGFIISKGYTSVNGNYGGGMYNVSCSPIVRNCIFSDNIAWTYGGGMYNGGGAAPIITNCVFLNNDVLYHYALGGGMYNNNGSPTVENCLFIANRANAGGAGIFHGIASGVIKNCVFYRNAVKDTTYSITYGGGGICRGGSLMTITNCIFEDNRAGSYAEGGAINLFMSSPTITNCNIINNEADNFGGIYNRSDCHPEITNCILWGNQGPEIYDDNYGVVPSSTTVNYSDIEGGWSGAGGNNINVNPSFVTDSWTGEITEAQRDTSISQYILTDSNASWQTDELVGKKLYLINSSHIIKSNTSTTITLWFPNGYSSIPPSFLPLPYEITDYYHLTSGSPCVEEGDPSGSYSGQTDIDGEDRVIDGDEDQTAVVDMGVDEYNPN